MLGSTTKPLVAQLLSQHGVVFNALEVITKTVGVRAASTGAAAGWHTVPQHQLEHKHFQGCSCSSCARRTVEPACSSGSVAIQTTGVDLRSSGCPASSSRTSSSSTARLAFSHSCLGATRGFACYSAAVSHGACGHDHGDHGHACGAGPAAEQLISQIKATDNLGQLQDLVQHSSDLSPSSTAAAFRQSLVLAANHNKTSPEPAPVDPVLQALTPIWLQQIQQASITDLSDCLFSCCKLGFKDEPLWSKTLAAVPAQCVNGDGRDLANIAYAVAAMAERNAGNVPGVSHDEAEEVLRAVTHQVVTLAQGGASDHSHGHNHEHGEGDCGHHHHKSDKKSVTIGHISTVRWAHEVFESHGTA